MDNQYHCLRQTPVIHRKRGFLHSACFVMGKHFMEFRESMPGCDVFHFTQQESTKWSEQGCQPAAQKTLESKCNLGRGVLRRSFSITTERLVVTHTIVR